MENENPILTSTVTYTITVKQGRFCVSGVDESDGTVLAISNVSWDSTALRFVSLFPPTNHQAHHVLRLIRAERVQHEVSYSDEDGEHVSHELWRKRLPPRQRG